MQLFAKYRNKYRQQAANIVRQYKLQVITDDYTEFVQFNDGEVQGLQNDKDNKYLDELKKKYANKATTSFINVVRSGNQIIGLNIGYYGLNRFVENLASADARLHSGYFLDLMPNLAKKQLEWNTQQAKALVMILSLYDPKRVKKGIQLAWDIVKDIYSVIDFYSVRVWTIYTEEKTKIYMVKSFSLKAVAAMYSDASQKQKDKSAGKNQIFQGYEPYANGGMYKLGQAGSQRFTPEQAYQPHMAQMGATPNFYDGAGAHTQGRAHYNQAGNDGYLDKAAPDLQLAKIDDLKNDIEFKQNVLNQNLARIKEGMSELGVLLLSDLKNPQGINSVDWIQATHDYNAKIFIKVYQTYVQSKDMLNRLSSYNSALRMDMNFYNAALEESRQEIKKERAKELANDPAKPNKKVLAEMEQEQTIDEQLRDFVYQVLMAKYAHLDEDEQILKVEGIVRLKTREYYEVLEELYNLKYVRKLLLNGASEKLKRLLVGFMIDFEREASRHSPYNILKLDFSEYSKQIYLSKFQTLELELLACEAIKRLCDSDDIVTHFALENEADLKILMALSLLKRIFLRDNKNYKLYLLRQHYPSLYGYFGLFLSESQSKDVSRMVSEGIKISYYRGAKNQPLANYEWSHFVPQRQIYYKIKDNFKPVSAKSIDEYMLNDDMEWVLK